MQELNFWIIIVIVTAILIVFLFIIFMVSRYRKFRTNQFVIHLRHGKVKSAGLGGNIWLLPLIDDYIIIPTTSIQTNLEAHEQVLSKEYQSISITGMLIWKVIEPEKAFSAVSWDPRNKHYVETILKNAAEAIIRTTCANMEIEKIIRERSEIIKGISKELHQLTSDWGIIIESIEIREVNILDKELKKNMEAIKQAEQLQSARIARAESEQLSRLRELEVKNEVGIRDQVVEKDIELKRKEKEIAIAQQERERKKIEADGERQKIVIEAEAQAEQIKKKLIAKAEGEAEVVRRQMLAQAEGYLKQVEAIGNADARFLTAQLIDILPKIYENIKPEKMFIMGSGDESFSSLSKSILPFIALLPEFKKLFEDGKLPIKEETHEEK
ncbi:MAG TPA: SPFH domain-containing protein [Candidatus Deferrimicrobium sp.]|nr:SPFH domain-containing protein [Candidatus Deferrimicrobium sp.]